MHRPVLAKQAIEALNIKPDGKYIDATAGEGGHTNLIAQTGAQVLALDWDKNQTEQLRTKLTAANISFATGNYADIAEIAKANGFSPVDGVLIDLGLSYKQISMGGRGFSYKNAAEPLDMRISDELDQTAADILNSVSEQDLYDLLASNSEELHSKAIAASIIRNRKLIRYEVVGDLLHAIDEALAGEKRYSNNGVYAQIFQALRIVVNHEFDNIKKGLHGAISILNPKGRVVVITFHSLEDRIVKQFARRETNILQTYVSVEPEFKFERSAKIRILEKI